MKAGLSEDRHQDTDVLIFKKDVDGEMTVLTEAHIGNGYLLVNDCWRRKKRPSRTTGKNPSANVQNETRSTSQKDTSSDGNATKLSSVPNKKSSGIADIREKYRAAKAVEGDGDEVQIGKEIIPGRWKLVEADTPTASHDERSFNKTPGYPVNEDGSTVNDRDYEHDKDAQLIVNEIAGDYDGQAVSVDNPVIVTDDGVVISGNNRTMSSKLAAAKGTDAKYIEALKKRAKKFGFTAEQVGEFKHPRVVFETAANGGYGGYSTEQFAKFNRSSKKAMSPVEAAVKVSKTMKPETVTSIAEKMSGFDTLGELYANGNTMREIFSALRANGVVSEMDMPQYFTDGGVTGAGKEFLETVLIGSVVSESNIRGLNRAGCKSIRQKLVRAITPLIENKDMQGYSITKELNQGIDIAMQAALLKDKFKDVAEFIRQKNMFEKLDPVGIELAKKLEGTQKGFAEFMQTMNGGLKYAANGEADIFLGDVESREDILARMLNLEGLKKAIHNIVKSLTWSGHKLQGRTKFQGMDISIENRKGSIRSGVDKDGHEWRTFMHWPYGYIRGTVGKDKDHVDCYIGPNPESEKVFVVHQVDPYNGGKYDEDKVMLGWDDAKSAKKAYLGQYDSPDYFGSPDSTGECNVRITV